MINSLVLNFLLKSPSYAHFHEMSLDYYVTYSLNLICLLQSFSLTFFLRGKLFANVLFFTLHHHYNILFVILNAYLIETIYILYP